MENKLYWIGTKGLEMKNGLKSPFSYLRAQEETRTPMPFQALPPQDSVSTNFTTWARGDSAGIRTQDPLIKSQMLYQLSYRIMCE